MNFSTSLNGTFGTNERSTASWLHHGTGGYTLFLPRRNQQWYPDLLEGVSKGFLLRHKAWRSFSKLTGFLCLAFIASLLVAALLAMVSGASACPEVRSAWSGTAWLTGLILIVWAISRVTRWQVAKKEAAALARASEIDCATVHVQTESLSECEAILQAWDALSWASQQNLLKAHEGSGGSLKEEEFRILLARSDRTCAG
ncbi:hypothetical protein ACLQ8T_16745 (plasmid) [Glutamicibacter sp. FR1]|uniref:hypothetical protein n=1 Tax=Glutamicibacter sp. FR1 TaxID=3393744 RepID=UPI0039AF6C6E